MIKIGIDARLKNQTGVGRYIRNLYFYLKKLNLPYQIDFFQPEIKWHSLAEQIKLLFWLWQRNYDLVHFTYFSLPVFYPKKFIITVHDLIPWHFKTGKASRLPVMIYFLKHFFYKLVLWFSVRRAEKIIAVSEATKKEIIKHLGIKPQKIKVIYEGVEEKFQYQTEKKREDKLKFGQYFLYVGNAYPHKNVNVLIEVFEEINCRLDYKLVLVGPNDYFYQNLKEKIKNKKKEINSMIFYGPANDNELLSLYDGAEALINPSSMEGFGLTGLEAMAVGCPVICSAIPAFLEIYGPAALYFKVNKADLKNELKRAIEKFLSLTPTEKQRLVKLGKIQVKKYSWQRCVKQTLEVYESCLGL